MLATEYNFTPVMKWDRGLVTVYYYIRHHVVSRYTSSVLSTPNAILFPTANILVTLSIDFTIVIMWFPDTLHLCF